MVLARGGVGVSPGVALGQAVVARKEADMLSFPKGGILVVERALPRWAPLLSRAAGLVSETGGMAGHLASVAREYGVPALCGLAGACSLLEKAGEVTLDAGRNAVFAGLQSQLVPALASKPNLMAGSPVYQRLAALARLMVPLRLLDRKRRNSRRSIAEVCTISRASATKNLWSSCLATMPVCPARWVSNCGWGSSCSTGW